MTATLYVVATPLGNLDDLSTRAAEVLRRVPVVAAEDTRRTAKLMAHLGAGPTLLSFHSHSPDRRRETLLAILSEGRDVALVSDAGTPVISDPGADLVTAVRAAGHAVVPIPGPSAVATALSASGLGGDRYLFLGFLPRKGPERRQLLERAAAEPWPVVLFESPGRLVTLLQDLIALTSPERSACVARELTKLHEEIRMETLEGLLRHFGATPARGEVTVILGPRPRTDAPAPDAATATEVVRRLLAEGRSRKDAVVHLTETMGWSRNDAYRLVNSIDA